MALTHISLDHPAIVSGDVFSCQFHSGHQQAAFSSRVGSFSQYPCWRIKPTDIQTFGLSSHIWMVTNENEEIKPVCANWFQLFHCILLFVSTSFPCFTSGMRGIEMEMYDGNFPLLQKMMFTTDDAQAFKGADYAILLLWFGDLPVIWWFPMGKYPPFKGHFAGASLAQISGWEPSQNKMVSISATSWRRMWCFFAQWGRLWRDMWSQSAKFW